MRSIIKFALLYSLLNVCVDQRLSAAVLVKDKMWPQNQTLNVVFLDGSAAQKSMVKRVAPAWIESTSLQLAFFPDLASAPQKTHIRISFQSHTGSMLGNHGELKARTATLQLSLLDSDLLDTEYAKRYVLHEFGHALGLEHEYRNPNWPHGQAAIDEHIENCLPRLQALGYAVDEARGKCAEINRTIPQSLVNTTIYDPHSIMNYPQTIEKDNQPPVLIRAKSQLSTLDKLAMQRWYGGIN